MQQHAVPQAVTAYKFKLVGDMTLKQFGELAIGLVGGWLIFNSEMNILLKWTFGPLVGFFGFALAFLPIEDRPLDLWIINFIKAIYKPTQFTFQVKSKTLSIFKKPSTKPQTNQADLPPPHQLEDYLQTLPATPASTFDQAESKYLDHVSNLFGALGVPIQKTNPQTSSDTPVIKSPVKGVRIRKLHHPEMCLLPHATVYQAPSEPQQASMPIKVKPAPTNNRTVNTVRQKPLTDPTLRIQGKPQLTKPITAKPKVLKSPTNNRTVNTVRQKSFSQLNPTNAGPTPKPTQTPVFAKDIILPLTPEKPNLLTGITLDKVGKIINNVILEIRDSKNHPVRALKSNKLGQFFISTPLPDGVYQIQAEHSDHRFAIMKLEVKGEIIPPLKIQAN